ncbi:hypothetical protein QN382_18840 [Pseudomonas sp. 10B1]|nr:MULTISPECIES: hypothetical protein [unclassified Pseudomonas]MDY7559790.1 hypothetical protein [Pseudomonas sp. AB6]MEA9976615.1 hypothetical protein [Pseudomonas sp. RTS4]MEA9992973.1 hypothetical protein [Pseudomonas sp. AA4]MEB0085916.1 hypothetical protein [Pseudomonas sp. RTI1]MEB0125649.1 hypothetical protein [Pseudomonas sp. CCC1.2]
MSRLVKVAILVAVFSSMSGCFFGPWHDGHWHDHRYADGRRY